MTDLLKQAVDVVSKLPEDQQDSIATMMLNTAKGKMEDGPDFESIKHLFGVAEGPADLSTNPKYMEGFGQSSLR
jgi:hypothetical protein